MVVDDNGVLCKDHCQIFTRKYKNSGVNLSGKRSFCENKHTGSSLMMVTTEENIQIIFDVVFLDRRIRIGSVAGLSYPYTHTHQRT